MKGLQDTWLISSEILKFRTLGGFASSENLKFRTLGGVTFYKL